MKREFLGHIPGKWAWIPGAVLPHLAGASLQLCREPKDILAFRALPACKATHFLLFLHLGTLNSMEIRTSVVIFDGFSHPSWICAQQEAPWLAKMKHGVELHGKKSL